MIALVIVAVLSTLIPAALWLSEPVAERVPASACVRRHRSPSPVAARLASRAPVLVIVVLFALYAASITVQIGASS